MGSTSPKSVREMNAVPRDRDFRSLRSTEAQPLIHIGPDYLNRGVVLNGFVGDAASFSPRQFPSSLLEDHVEECMYFHSDPPSVAAFVSPSSPVSHQEA